MIRKMIQPAGPPPAREEDTIMGGQQS
ncbi:unnamed protein product [Podospora anserina S mat+]|uniref:Podospora anserina S mat+ genomic DNA chromosome 1, supercontig 4 n=2 Tax=Podospora TaxID=5144 RepID=B2AUT2_PODAN|nr:unnamed protein product [Podospora anserina S mat+]